MAAAANRPVLSQANVRRIKAGIAVEELAEDITRRTPLQSLTATKILWGQVLVVFLIVLATVWGATQWVAWRLGYQAQLGQPMDVWAGVPVYPPPAFFLWWYWYDAAPRVFYEGAVIAAAGGFAAIGIAIGIPSGAREANRCSIAGA